MAAHILKCSIFYTQSSLILHTGDIREVHALHSASSCLKEDCLKNFNNPIKYSYNCIHIISRLTVSKHIFSKYLLIKICSTQLWMAKVTCLTFILVCFPHSSHVYTHYS